MSTSHVRHHDAFVIPAWTCDLTDLSGLVEPCADAVETHIAAAEPEGASRLALPLGPQPSGIWNEFLRIVDVIGQEVIASELRGEARVGAAVLGPAHALWVSGNGPGVNIAESLRAVPSGPRSVLTCALDLVVPTEIVGIAEAGLAFRDPPGAAGIRPAWTYLESTPLRMTVFPSFVDFAPVQVVRPTGLSEPRVLLVTEWIEAI